MLGGADCSTARELAGLEDDFSLLCRPGRLARQRRLLNPRFAEADDPTVGGDDVPGSRRTRTPDEIARGDS
jgi:hypothetical protein